MLRGIGDDARLCPIARDQPAGGGGM